MSNSFVVLDDDIIQKMREFPFLFKDGKVSDVLLKQLEGIYDANDIEAESTNTFKGMFIKRTEHYLAVGYRTEIGIIFQDYISKSSGRHFVDYIIVDEETGKYNGRVEDCCLNKNGRWTISVGIKNLGTSKEPVIKG